VLTPAEFVAAGDYLVTTAPTWSWSGGEPSLRRTFLPPQKQYLVTRNVPCYRRAAAEAAGIPTFDDEADSWLAPGRAATDADAAEPSSAAGPVADAVPDISGAAEQLAGASLSDGCVPQPWRGLAGRWRGVVQLPKPVHRRAQTSTQRGR